MPGALLAPYASFTPSGFKNQSTGFVCEDMEFMTVADRLVAVLLVVSLLFFVWLIWDEEN